VGNIRVYRNTNKTRRARLRERFPQNRSAVQAEDSDSFLLNSVREDVLCADVSVCCSDPDGSACCLGFQIFPPLVLGATQRAVALPTQGQKTAPGAMAVVTGWGATHVSTDVRRHYSQRPCVPCN
jgi:hypothetical protein